MLSWKETSGLFVLFMYFILASTAWLLPLKTYLKNWTDAIKLCIPLSLSLHILFAYIFYTFDITRHYPLAYAAFVISINIGVGIWLWKHRTTGRRSVPIQFFTLLVLMFVWALFIYTRFYDSFSTAAPGAIDTLNHMRFMRDLQSVGHLSFQTYAPGFHLLIYPINLIIGDGLTYRFVGPVIGLLVGISLYFLYRSDIRTLPARLLIPALFCVPIFTPLSLQTISFFPTALTFILLPAILSPLIHDYKQIGKGIYRLTIILILALSVTVPYLFVQVIPPFVILIPLVFLLRAHISASISKKIVIMATLLVIGFCVALVLTYVQGKLFAPTVSFPTVGLVPTPTDSGDPSGSGRSAISWFQIRFAEELNQSPLYTSFIRPFLSTGSEIVRVKEIRPPSTILSAGAYVWGILSIGILIWSVRRKYFHIVLTSYLCILFTIVTQTGIFEITTYRGRTGWYLLLFTLLTIVFVLDKMKVMHKPYALFAPLLLAATGLILPPTFYRPFQPHIFDVAHRLIKDAPQDNIVFYANEPALDVLSTTLTVIPATPVTIDQPCPPQTHCYLLIEKTYQAVDPFLSQRVDTFKSNLETLNAQTQTARSAFETNKQMIESSDAFKTYRPIIKDSEITVYEQ